MLKKNGVILARCSQMLRDIDHHDPWSEEQSGFETQRCLIM